jgi:hypothetical protein
VKALPQPGSGCSAQLAGVAAGLPGLADTAQNLPNQIDREMGNWLELTFSSFSPSRSGAVAIARPKAIQSPAVQPRCTSLPKFAKHEISNRLRSPTVGLGCRVVCTTFEFAQKKEARPVGGRGISAFFIVFFVGEGFFRSIGVCKVKTPPVLDLVADIALECVLLGSR